MLQGIVLLLYKDNFTKLYFLPAFIHSTGRSGHHESPRDQSSPDEAPTDTPGGAQRDETPAAERLGGGNAIGLYNLCRPKSVSLCSTHRSKHMCCKLFHKAVYH